jgi:hypothetical protein
MAFIGIDVAVAGSCRDLSSLQRIEGAELTLTKASSTTGRDRERYELKRKDAKTRSAQRNAGFIRQPLPHKCGVPIGPLRALRLSRLCAFASITLRFWGLNLQSL